MRVWAALLLVFSLGGPVAELGAQSVAELTRRGWSALNTGRPAEASRAFEAALKAGPRDPSALVGAATAAYLVGRPDAARLHLLEALEHDPALTPASVLLGELLYRAGDLDGAIAVYQQASTYAPASAQLARRLDAWRKEGELHGRFNRQLGVHFTVLFEGPAEAGLAAAAVEILEKAYWRLGAALYAYPPDITTVVLYTRDQFRDITQSPAWAGAAFDGRIRIPVQGAMDNTREFERVLTHELAHAFIQAVAGRRAPRWLEEGLAMHFEGGDVAPHLAVMRRATALPPLQDLEGSFAALNGPGARLAYAQSAVAVERLVEMAGIAVVPNLLADIGAGVPFGVAFERHVQVPYPEFQEAFMSPPSAF